MSPLAILKDARYRKGRKKDAEVTKNCYKGTETQQKF